MASLASRLPADVLRLIFDLEEQPAVLAAAAVSRAWRATAVRDRHYYRDWTFVFPPEEHPKRGMAPRYPGDTDPERFLEIVREAEQQQYPLSMTICVQRDEFPYDAVLVADREAPDTMDEMQELDEEKEEQDLQRVEETVVPILRRAVPVLARLDLQAEPNFANVVLSALSVAAPRLWDLSIFIWHYDENDDPGELRVGLFAGSAPLLSVANLRGVRLHPPLPCFATVRHLDIEANFIHGQLPPAAASFPRVRHLGMLGLIRPPEDAASATEMAFFRRLHYLLIDYAMPGLSMVPFLSAMTHIAEIDITVWQDAEALAPLLATPAPHELEFCEYAPDEYDPIPRRTFSQLRLQLSTPTTVRTLDASIDYDIVYRTLVLSGATQNVSKLTIDDRLFLSFVTACPSMPLLEELCIVLLVWSAPSRETGHQDPKNDCACPGTAFARVDSRPPDGSSTIYCPRLSTLELYGVRAEAVAPTDVLHALSRALNAPHLVLSNGLALADVGSEATLGFRSTLRSPCAFSPSGRTARVKRLLQQAAKSGDRAHAPNCPHFQGR